MDIHPTAPTAPTAAPNGPTAQRQRRQQCTAHTPPLYPRISMDIHSSAPPPHHTKPTVQRLNVNGINSAPHPIARALSRLRVCVTSGSGSGNGMDGASAVPCRVCELLSVLGPEHGPAFKKNRTSKILIRIRPRKGPKWLEPPSVFGTKTAPDGKKNRISKFPTSHVLLKN